ncbi:hypothetical protein PT015_21865 [Candidatus Mycobacterium wuenschmannii]|uniref:GIY-YIG nuclease family protein n=1 Tax=Candidatus Mycobacterium wuenschmannii TaxID=3027808 RepID=A0ABY8VUY7_9MYCO|nr:hypothetical protein [Candidatus Mycobacterium wuenschmannii]WIM87455.1 hypothetical protein PT015_21865 [Candidatus Mycobacterium wuenschmannii]
MPTSAATLLNSANLNWLGASAWLDRIPLDQPGVYLVSLSGLPEECPTQSECHISPAAVQQLLSRRPELLLDRRRPSWTRLAERISSMWLRDESIVYIGLAGTSVAQRVAQYYRTPLGAERPHAGGWPLKTLADLNHMWVHYAPCAAPDEAERKLLHAFSAQVSPSSRAALYDAQLAIPFANLVMPGGRRKRHGITGARGPIPSSRTSDTEPQDAELDTWRQRPIEPVTLGQAAVTQRVTEADLRGGAIRIPSSSKSLFPTAKQDVEVILRGAAVEARWDPRNGPDRSRSGVLRIGTALLRTVVAPDERLTIVVRDDRSITLE